MKPIEYEFTLPDGSKRYEIIDPDSDVSIVTQISMFSAMHGAISAAPVNPTLKHTDSEDEMLVRSNMDPHYFMALQAAIIFAVRIISPERFGEEYNKVFRALAHRIRKDAN